MRNPDHRLPVLGQGKRAGRLAQEAAGHECQYPGGRTYLLRAQVDLAGNTYTMTFRRNDPSGMAALVPRQREIETIDDLKAEVEALWKAEAPNSQSGAIGSGWGCVGALHGSDESRKALAQAWNTHFRTCRTEGLSVVDVDGIQEVRGSTPPLSV